jgi:hypothetical protein
LGSEQAWFNSQTLKFFYFVEEDGRWTARTSCEAEIYLAYGIAIHREHPFLDAPPSWQCGNEDGFETGSLQIACAHFEGQARACQPGTFDASGAAPDGTCAGVCPPHLPTSFVGATSADACMTFGSNLLTVSTTSDKLLEFNPDESNFRTRVDEGILRYPQDVTCVSELSCLITNYVTSEVRMVNLQGEDQGVFAVVANPEGILHVPDLNLVVVCGGSVEKVFVFSLEGYEQREQPLQVSKGAASYLPHLTTLVKLTKPQMSDAVQFIDLPGDGPTYATLGEFDNEILVSTLNGFVYRRCLDSAGCKDSVRNTVMLRGGDGLNGIGVLRERDTYIVADRYAAEEAVFECPLGASNLRVNDCEVFAERPLGAYWDPWGLLVDNEKRVVYISDYTNSDVFVFSFDRDFLGPLASKRGSLNSPAGMAIRPGLYAPLSPASTPDTEVAGSKITSSLLLLNRLNDTVSSSHPTYVRE